MSGGSGGGSSNETSTQVVDLPDWAKGYAKEGLGKAAALTDTTQNPYQRTNGIGRLALHAEQAFKALRTWVRLRLWARRLTWRALRV
jgi:hypothetical protein